MENLTMILNKEKVIENLSVHIDYSHLYQINFKFNVRKFYFNINTYDVVEEITNIASNLALSIDELIQKTSSENLSKVRNQSKKSLASG